MKKFLRNAVAASLAALVSFSMISCGDDGPEPVSAPAEVTFSPKNYVAKNGKVTLKADKGAVIYYEIAAKDAAATITGSNYESFTKSSKNSMSLNAANVADKTVYAVAVRDSVASKVVKMTYAYAKAGADSDAETLHDMILPPGTRAKINAWGKSANAYATDLPEVVTCFTDDDNKTLSGATNRTPELVAALDAVNATNFFDDKQVKNVIFVFADGWGESHNLGARTYWNNGLLIQDHLPYHAPVNHDSYNSPAANKYATWTYDADKQQWTHKDNGTITGFKTTDSTAGGTAINTGFTTYYSACGVDIQGTEVRNIMELAREKGMLVGNVTNDWLNDATPITVSIHSPKRYDTAIGYGRMFIVSPDWSMGNGGFSDYLNSPAMFSKFEHHEYAAQDPGHLEQWYKANMANGRLKKWATKMLNEYDGKNVDETYDFISTWTADRKLKSYGTFAAALKDLDDGKDTRPLISFDKEHKFKYDGTVFSESTGNYTTAPRLGYKLGYRAGETVFPNYAEMVASTLYFLDKKAKAQNRGFFAFIENTCPDGWGHACEQYDCMSEAEMTDEGIAIAIKYVLENPDTLLVISADHETGGIEYDSGWDTDYKKIVSRGGGDHSSEPVPVYAFGAGAKANWGDVPAFDMSNWTADEKAAWVKGDVYPPVSTWHAVGYAEATKQPANGKYPKILRNRTTGIRIGKAMGFDNFGDLNGNGILDPDTEFQSIVNYEAVGTKQN